MPEKECLKSENCVYFYLTTAKSKNLLARNSKDPPKSPLCGSALDEAFRILSLPYPITVLSDLRHI